MNLKDQLQGVFGEFEKSKADPVRIGLLGQPGAGKSSLINSITGKDGLAPVGVGTDHTKEASSYDWNEIQLVDLPGYGTEGFPRDGFLERFEVLKFDALLCVASGKFRDADCEFFRKVREAAKPCLFVRTNLDGLRQKGRTETELQADVKADLERQLAAEDFRLFFVDNISGRGVTELDEAISGLLPPARREKFDRWAKGTSDAFLARKREACNRLVLWYCAGSAANALNPVPGAGVAVDLGIVAKMQVDILACFGFDQAMLRDYMARYEVLATFIAPLLNTLGKEAVTLLLARFAGKEMAKWIPFVGPAIAASAGAGLVWWAGQDAADRCLDIARRVRDAEMAKAA